MNNKKNIENINKTQENTVDDKLYIKSLPITSKEKNGIFEAWVENNDI